LLSNLFQNFDDKLESLRKMFNKHNLSENKAYIQWKKDFIKFYHKKSVNLELYVHYSLLYFLWSHLIAKHIFKDTIILNNGNFREKFKKFRDKLADNFPNLSINKLNYFNPILRLFSNKELTFISSIINNLLDLIESQNIKTFYYLDFALQYLIPSDIRHETGEFYTPPFLTKKMVDFAYKFGESVLDPCCGSGNFLLTIINKILESDKTEENKISAINRIVGIDINPLSIFITEGNFLLLLKDKYPKIDLKLYIFDSLELHRKIKKNSFDLIISNPPWFTLRDVNSIEKQEYIKELAELLGIKPRAKNILNIEIATVFFYRSIELYLKEGGKIFFILSKGILNGSHASRFRNFNNLENILIWSFTSSIQNLFNVEFICLFGKKLDKNRKAEKSKNEIPNLVFKLKKKDQNVNYFENLQLKISEKQNLIPFDIIKKNGKIYTKKLISEKEKIHLGDLNESPYKKLFHKGADLNPRNLIFVKIEEIKGDYFEINPDKRIFKRAKSPWRKEEFKNEIVEKDYVFHVVKSTELVKFYVYDFYNVFLPISKNTLEFNYKNIEPYSRKFYDKINGIYMQLKKSTTKNNSLMDNLNRWSKLCNERQKAQIKVVYNNSGSILKSAVLQKQYLITGDLSFYTPESLKEAYYLSAVLNSSLLTQKIKIMKSSRHIFKLPFNLPIKKFDKNNKNHQMLAKYGKDGENLSREYFKKYLESHGKNISKRKFEKSLRLELKSLLEKIDSVLKKEL